MTPARHARDWLLLLGTNLPVLDPNTEGRAAPDKALKEWMHAAEAWLDRPPGYASNIPAVRGRGHEWLETRLSRRALLAKRLDELDRNGIRITTIVDDDYPRRLRDVLEGDAPVVLYYAGDNKLAAAGRIIGFTGSRDASGASLEATAQIAKSCAAASVVVCSGGARGVDQEAEEAALGAGGSMVLCPPLGLKHILRQRRFREAVLRGKLLCISAIDPDAGWHVGHAMARNDLIYAMSTLVCVMHAGKQSGGTWEGSTTALERGRTPIATWMGEGSGPANQILMDRGAYPIATTQITEIIAELRTGQGMQRVSRNPKKSTPRKLPGRSETGLFSFGADEP